MQFMGSPVCLKKLEPIIHDSVQLAYCCGLKAAQPALIFIENGFLGNRHSFLVTKEIKGQRLDDALLDSANFDTITSGISVFFKRLRWINFKHGDAKTSNFFISGKNIIALDLDTAGYENFFSRFNGVSRDKKRLLKSIANYPKLHTNYSNGFRRWFYNRF